MRYIKFYLMDNLKEISLALTTQSTQASGGGKGRRMVGEEGGCGKGGRATAQGHVGTPIGRMQVAVHPHQMVGKSCKDKEQKVELGLAFIKDDGNFFTELNL